MPQFVREASEQAGENSVYDPPHTIPSFSAQKMPPLTSGRPCRLAVIVFNCRIYLRECLCPSRRRSARPRRSRRSKANQVRYGTLGSLQDDRAGRGQDIAEAKPICGKASPTRVSTCSCLYRAFLTFRQPSSFAVSTLSQASNSSSPSANNAATASSAVLNGRLQNVGSCRRLMISRHSGVKSSSVLP